MVVATKLKHVLELKELEDLIAHHSNVTRVKKLKEKYNHIVKRLPLYEVEGVYLQYELKKF